MNSNVSVFCFFCLLAVGFARLSSDEAESQCAYVCPDDNAARGCCRDRGFETGYCRPFSGADCEGKRRNYLEKVYPVCDNPCKTGGHVKTCCKNHGYSAGYCKGDRAFCNY